MDLSPLDYMMKKFPEIKERDEMRKIVGRYGITGKQQVISVKSISRKIFVKLISPPLKYITRKREKNIH